MSAVDMLLGNLKNHGIEYLVCIAALVGAVNYLGNHRQPRKFLILGVALILGALLGGAVLQMLLYQVIVGSSRPDGLDFRRHVDALSTWGTVSSVLGFVTGLAQAAGLASVVYAVFVDKVEFAAKARPKRRRDDDDEDDRPRRRRPARDEDEDEDDDEPRPRRRSRDD